MRILIDIGHPAHVHYFRSFIKIMNSKGHSIVVTARDKEVTQLLLSSYNIPFVSRGKGGKGFWGKLFYLFKGDWIVYRTARKFKADMLISFASPYSAHASMFLSKPHIAFDDTEIAKIEQFIFLPVTNTVLTPSCFYKDFGKKHIRFNGYMELCTLHPNYFKPDLNAIKSLLLTNDEPFVLLRFVSWGASHDFGQKGLSYTNKISLINSLVKRIKVYISSEGALPEELKQYQLKSSPETIHQVMAHATLFIGEGATMASECAMLGIPAIYVNTITAGTLEEQEKYGLLYGFRNFEGVLEKANEILSMQNLKEEFQDRRNRMLADKIDVTAFMVWFVENYPKSVEVMNENPDFQFNFK